MPSSDIPVPAYSSDESIGSSVLLVILSNTEMEMTNVPVVTPEVEAATVASHIDILDLTNHFDTEFDPPKDSSSSDHALVAPGVSLFYDSEPNFKSEPLEVPSKEDAPEPHEATMMERYSYGTFIIIIIFWQEIPLGRPYRTHLNGCRRMLTARKRVHLFPDRISANRRRFHSSSSPSPCKWFRVSPHSSSSNLLSSSSSSDGLSHKRGKSPTTCWQQLIRQQLCHPFELIFYPPHKRLRDSPSRHHHETRIKDSTKTGYEASVEDYTRTGIKSGAEASIEATAEVVAKPDLPLVLPKQTVAERLDDYKEVIQERHDHLLEMPL
ncbi:hypothetical protein Tco_1300220 [Tanacetum coccineum]